MTSRHASFICMLLAVVCMLLVYFCADVHADVAPKYRTAKDSAQNAFIIQSGIQDNINKLQAYGQKQGRFYINKFGLQTPSKIILAGYEIYRSKSIQIPINNSNRLELKMDRVLYTINL